MFKQKFSCLSKRNLSSTSHSYNVFFFLWISIKVKIPQAKTVWDSAFVKAFVFKVYITMPLKKKILSILFIGFLLLQEKYFYFHYPMSKQRQLSK